MRFTTEELLAAHKFLYESGRRLVLKNNGSEPVRFGTTKGIGAQIRVAGRITDVANVAILILYRALQELAPEHVWCPGRLWREECSFDFGSHEDGWLTEEGKVGRIPEFFTVPVKDPKKSSFEACFLHELGIFLQVTKKYVIDPLSEIMSYDDSLLSMREAMLK